MLDRDRPSGEIKRRRSGTQSQIETQILPSRLQHDALGCEILSEELLRQRWAVVLRELIGIDNDNASLVALKSQGARRVHPGEGRANDDCSLCHRTR